MINLKDCVELGLFTKPHGYKGQIILKLNKLSFDEIENMEWVYVLIDGLPVPFFVSEFSERNNGSIFMHIEDINSESQVRPLINKTVFIDHAILLPSGYSSEDYSFLINYSAIDSSAGEIGIINGIIEDPQNPLIQILKDKKEILIPLQEEFIEKINDNSKEIYFNCPKGLLDIF